MYVCVQEYPYICTFSIWAWFCPFGAICGSSGMWAEDKCPQNTAQRQMRLKAANGVQDNTKPFNNIYATRVFLRFVRFLFLLLWVFFVSSDCSFIYAVFIRHTNTLTCTSATSFFFLFVYWRFKNKLLTFSCHYTHTHIDTHR